MNGEINEMELMQKECVLGEELSVLYSRLDSGQGDAEGCRRRIAEIKEQLCFMREQRAASEKPSKADNHDSDAADTLAKMDCMMEDLLCEIGNLMVVAENTGFQIPEDSERLVGRIRNVHEVARRAESMVKSLIMKNNS